MSSTTLPPASLLTLDYRPDQHLLIGRWLRPAGLAELQASYEAVLTAARAHGNCRHWLLDVRRRLTGDLELMRWFGRDFSPRLGELGGSVYVAYFAMITQEVARDIADLRTNIDEAEQRGTHFHYFNREDEALAWLATQP